MLTNKEKLMLEEHLYRVIKSRLNEDQANDADKDAEERGKKASMTSKLQTILPALQDTYDDSKQSYNLTRSQISYEMYPNLDPDTARSKLSQKLNGKKNFKPKELNKLANIVSGDIA